MESIDLTFFLFFVSDSVFENIAGAEDQDPIPNLPTPERSPYPESWNSSEEDGDSEESEEGDSEEEKESEEEEDEEEEEDDDTSNDSGLEDQEEKELARAEADTQAIRDRIAKRKEAGGESSPSKKSKADVSEGLLGKVKREMDNRDLGMMILVDSDDEL